MRRPNGFSSRSSVSCVGLCFALIARSTFGAIGALRVGGRVAAMGFHKVASLLPRVYN